MNIDLNELTQLEISRGFDDMSARAKVCQDIILNAISHSSLSENITVKGGVVMRSRSRNTRRATQDLDIDFIRYSLSNESIDAFIKNINTIKNIVIKRTGEIEELKQQDYKGKRIFVEVSDTYDNVVIGKIDIGVHTHLDIEQEEYCFDISFDDEGVYIFANSNEQMFVEKLKSLLRFGTISTRYKDVYDLYFLSDFIETEKLNLYLKLLIFEDEKTREKSVADILNRLNRIFLDSKFKNRIDNSKTRWIDKDVDTICTKIIDTITSLDDI